MGPAKQASSDKPDIEQPPPTQQSPNSKGSSGGDSDVAAQPPSLADQHPFHDFPAHWQQRAAHRALPYFAHTHFTFHDPETGTLLQWSNRDQRKGRYPIVAEYSALGRQGVLTPRFRLWAWEWFDVSWHAAFWFLLGSCEKPYTETLTTAAAWLALAGGILFEIGSVFLILDALNSKRNAELGKERSVGGHLHATIIGRKHLGPWLRPALRKRPLAARLLEHAADAVVNMAAGVAGAAAGVAGATGEAAAAAAGAVGSVAGGGGGRRAGQNDVLGNSQVQNHSGGGAVQGGDAASQAHSDGGPNEDRYAKRSGDSSLLVVLAAGEENGGDRHTHPERGSSKGGSSSGGDVRVNVDSLYASAVERCEKPGVAAVAAGAPDSQGSSKPDLQQKGVQGAGANGSGGGSSNSGDRSGSGCGGGDSSGGSNSGSSAWYPEEAAGVPAWRWIGWDGRDIGFMASFLQLCGATIFLISVITGAPKVLPAEDESNYGLWDGVFWSPQVVGSVFFILSSFLYMVETQRKWWLPRPQTLGWHVGFWNLIGAVGFWLSGFFGYWGPPDLKYMDYGVLLCTWWGSCSFLIGSYAQLLECINKHPS